MKLTYYNSARYEETTTEEVLVILGNLDETEITDEDRAALRDGTIEPMCNYATPDRVWHAIPWRRVIEIDN